MRAATCTRNSEGLTRAVQARRILKTVRRNPRQGRSHEEDFGEFLSTVQDCSSQGPKEGPHYETSEKLLGDWHSGRSRGHDLRYGVRRLRRVRLPTRPCGL